MNDYYVAPEAPTDFTLARASVIKGQFDALEAAFDKLPDRDALLQGRVNFAVATGTGNALVATFTVAPEAYVEGASYRLKLIATNTGPTTLNVNALGAKNVLSSSGAALAGGELVTGNIQDFTYVGGAFRLPATGPAGPEGPVGPPDGRTVLNGTDDPAGGDGDDGDFYINTVSWKIFGPKAAGVWPAGVDMLGTDGANGAAGAAGTNGRTILYGAAAPGGGDGADGDFYIRTTTSFLYGPKAAGVWPAGTSLVGPQGIQGIQGDPGVQDTSDLALTGTNTVNALEIGFRDLPISRNVSANFTLAATDRGSAVTYDDTGDTCTVPLNASVAIAVGSIITIAHNGSGPLTIAREGAVVMKLSGTGANANRSLAVGGVVWLWKIATNTWFIGGSGVT